MCQTAPERSLSSTKSSSDGVRTERDNHHRAQEPRPLTSRPCPMCQKALARSFGRRHKNTLQGGPPARKTSGKRDRPPPPKQLEPAERYTAPAPAPPAGVSDADSEPACDSVTWTRSARRRSTTAHGTRPLRHGTTGHLGPPTACPHDHWSAIVAPSAQEQCRHPPQ